MIDFVSSNTVLVSPVTLRLKFSPREAVPSIWYGNYVKEQIGCHFRVAFPCLFGDFTASVPFLDELILCDLVACGDGSSGHASAGGCRSDSGANQYRETTQHAEQECSIPLKR